MIILMTICVVFAGVMVGLLLAEVISCLIEKHKRNKEDNLRKTVTEQIKLENHYRFDGLQESIDYLLRELEEIKKYIYEKENKKNVKKRRSR